MQYLKIKLTLLVSSLALLSCVTPTKSLNVKNEDPKHIVDTNYKVTFNTVKTYIQDCYQPKNLRANLYTEFPEAEIIIDQLRAASGQFIGAAYITYSQPSKEVINIKFVGKDNSTEIISKNIASNYLAKAALSKASCVR